jgi:hypothetical protein
VADKANPELAPMVEGIELTLKSMLDVVRKFGVEVIARYRHHRGANSTAVQGITFLHHGQHVARRHIFRLPGAGADGGRDRTDPQIYAGRSA